MASRPRTQKVPESAWFQHKDSIVDLYLREDLTVGTLAERMKADYGLNATISQYEAQLKVWNVRKNLKVHEWKPILERIDRLPADTRSRVILSGQPVPEHRIQRARRHCKSRSAKRRRLVDELEYSEAADVFIEAQRLDGTWSKLEETEALPITTGSPPPRFESVAEPGALVLSERSTDNSKLQQGREVNGPTPRDDIDFWFNSPRSPRHSALPDLNMTMGQSGFPQFDDMAQSGSWEASLFGLQRENGWPVPTTPSFSSQPGAHSIPQGTKSPTLYLPPQWFEELFSTRFVDAIASKVRPFTRGLYSRIPSEVFHLAQRSQGLPSKRPVLSLLSTLPPGDVLQFTDDSNERLISTPEILEAKFIRAIIFAMVNGFAIPDDIPLEDLVKFLARSENMGILFTRFLGSSKSHAAKAFAESLFPISIQAKEDRLVSQLLDTGLIDVNRPFNIPEGRTSTALEIAAATVASTLEDTEAREVVHHLLRAWKRSHRELFDPFPQQVDWGVITAAKRQHLSFVTLLLPYCKSMEKVLSASIRGNSNELIALIMEQNPKIAGDAHNIETIGARPTLPGTETEPLTTPLAEAILIRNLPLVRRLEEAGALQRLDQGMQFDIALASAAKVGDAEYVRKLLALCPRAESSAKARALQSAAENNQTDIALELLDANAGLSIRGRDAFERTNSRALIAAIENRNVRLVRAILNSDAPISRDDSIGDGRYIREASIEAAFKWGDQSIIRDLIAAYPQTTFPSSLYVEALKNEDRNTFEYLLALTKPSRESLNDCLQIAIEKDDSSLGHYLIEKGAGVSEDELSYAADMGSPAMLREVLDHIIHRHTHTITRGFGTDAMINAIQRGINNTECMDILLSSGRIDIDCIHANVFPLEEEPSPLEDEPSPLENDHHVKIILPRNVSPLGLTILMERNNSTKDLGFPIIKRLLDRGCDANSIVEYTTIFSQTVLLMAIEVGDKELVQFFIDRGADIHQAPNFSVKRSPLQGAAEAGNLEIVKLLLDKGADVNGAPARSRGGTALQLAAISGNCNIAAELLTHGALLTIPPSRVNGRWPIEGAAEHGRLTMTEFLWKANENIFYPDPCETG
ncbi:hypothetical protein DL770_005864 [Monosporascus sp. CRB-9-2]|nr:hypothetical protein DL770_005864 [Monosporascus sp. CRB-9-2]